MFSLYFPIFDCFVPTLKNLQRPNKIINEYYEGVKIPPHKSDNYYEVVKSNIPPEAAWFLDSRVYSASKNFFSASPL